MDRYQGRRLFTWKHNACAGETICCNGVNGMIILHAAARSSQAGSGIRWIIWNKDVCVCLSRHWMAFCMRNDTHGEYESQAGNNK